MPSVAISSSSPIGAPCCNRRIAFRRRFHRARSVAISAGENRRGRGSLRRIALRCTCVKYSSCDSFGKLCRINAAYDCGPSRASRSSGASIDDMKNSAVAHRNACQFRQKWTSPVPAAPSVTLPCDPRRESPARTAASAITSSVTALSLTPGDGFRAAARLFVRCPGVPFFGVVFAFFADFGVAGDDGSAVSASSAARFRRDDFRTRPLADCIWYPAATCACPPIVTSGDEESCAWPFSRRRSSPEVGVPRVLGDVDVDDDLLGDSPKNVSRHAASAESASACIAAKSTSSTCVERKDREDH
eukprot:m.26829 g.26829  ORF g.26829 m.26829 type:complete len:302 (+) comp11847_c0_seq2:3526-4431(+)